MKDARLKEKEVIVLRSIVESELGILLSSKSHKPNVIDAKRIFSLILKNRGHSFAQISDLLGCGHSQVSVYARTMRMFIKTNQSPKEEYYRILSLFNKSIRKHPDVSVDQKKEVHLNYRTWGSIKPEYTRLRVIYELISISTPVGMEMEMEGVIRAAILKLGTNGHTGK